MSTNFKSTMSAWFFFASEKKSSGFIAAAPLFSTVLFIQRPVAGCEVTRGNGKHSAGRINRPFSDIFDLIMPVTDIFVL
jgi:hypothetical protein